MITWQEVVDASAISGTPVGYSSGGTTISSVILSSATELLTYDWFGGQLVSLGTTEDFPIFLAEDFVDATFDENGGTYLYAWETQHSFSNGLRKTTLKTFTVIQPDQAANIVGDTGTSISEEYDSNWSRSEANLYTYSLTTLSNQAGRTITEIETQEKRFTTTLAVGNTTTTESDFNITRTTTTLVADSTVATWQGGKTYDTVILTGQTVVQHFSSFSNEVPVIYNESVSSLEAVNSTIERLSFVVLDTYADTTDTTLVSHSFTATSTAWTAEAQGSVVTNEINPQVTAGGSKATTANRFVILESTLETNADGVFTTKSTHTVLVTSKSVQFADTTIAATYASTTTAGSVTNGLNTDITYTFTGITHTQNGLFEITPINLFKTTRQAEIVALENVTVGVRAVSGGEVGGGVNADGQGQRFSLHTYSVVLPVTNITQKSGSFFTYSLNSYTVKDANGNTGTGAFDVTGNSINQYMTLAETGSFVQKATVLGGAIEGNAIVGNGVYQTFAGALEGATTVTEPLEIEWAASANTTAWIPSLRLETAVHAFDFLIPLGVEMVSRHSFTQVIDD